jgi:hypothetical protein
MTLITDYNTLIAAVQEVSENDGAEFLAYIPTAIALSEDLLYKELDLEDLDVKVTGTLTAANPMISKPSAFKAAKYMKITVNSNDILLKKRQEDFIIDYWPNSSQVDVPKYYTDASATQIRVAPTPDASYAYEIKHCAKPTKLSSTNPTNYFVTSCTDVLFCATMLQMCIFTKSTEQINIWTQMYTVARDTWNRSNKRTRRDNGSVPLNITNAPNNATQSA